MVVLSTGVQGCVYAASAAAAAVRTYISDSGSGSDLSRMAGYAMNDKGEHRKVLFFHLCPLRSLPASGQNLSFFKQKVWITSNKFRVFVWNHSGYEFLWPLKEKW